MMRYKALEMDETMSILNSSDEEDEVVTAVRRSKRVNVVYIPPEVNDEATDTENIDDEIIKFDEPLSKDVAGSVEIEYDVGENYPEGQEKLQTSLEPPSKKYKSEAEYGPASWLKRPFKYSREPVNVEATKIEDIVQTLAGKSPAELFALFLDEDLCAMVIEFSNKYAGEQNESLELEQYELKRFIGVLFLTGFRTLPEWKLYWSLCPTLEVPIVRNSLTLSRFEAIKRFIHLSDNSSLDKSDKYAKIRPFFDASNKRFLQFGIWSHNLSIDEQMIPYFGRESCITGIRGKLVRFGFKAWRLCSSSGYMYQTILYGGATTPHDKNVGFGEDVVFKLLENISSPLSHRIFFDKFFTSFHLMCLLSERGFFATANVRANRTGKAKLPENMKKGEYAAMYEHDKKLVVIKWIDNATVTMISNHSSIEPLAIAKRFDIRQKQHINIKVPRMKKEYNEGIGGVELHDNALGNYRIGIRGKKWWWPLFINTLSSMMVNAWKLHCMVAKSENSNPMPHLQFRVQVTEALLESRKTE